MDISKMDRKSNRTVGYLAQFLKDNDDEFIEVLGGETKYGVVNKEKLEELIHYFYDVYS